MQLHFLGTGTQETRSILSEAGFLIRTMKSTIIVDPGHGAANILAQLKIPHVAEIIATSLERARDAHLIKKEGITEIDINKKESGIIFTLPDFTITYIFEHVIKEPDQYKADTIILATHQDSILERLKPKLAILTRYYPADIKENPVYRARELQKKTRIQTIAAHDGLIVDLRSYGAVSPQKYLNKFTKE